MIESNLLQNKGNWLDCKYVLRILYEILSTLDLSSSRGI